MASTVADIVTRVREIVQDELPPYRYSNASIIRGISDGISEARRVRPDLFLVGWRQPTPQYSESNMTALVAIPDQYMPPLVNYIVGRVDLREDSFSQDGRAVSLLTAFSTALRGG